MYPSVFDARDLWIISESPTLPHMSSVPRNPLLLILQGKIQVQNELLKFQAGSEFDKKLREQELLEQKKAVVDAQRIRQRRENREKRRQDIAMEIAGDLGRSEEERLQKMWSFNNQPC